MPRMKYLCIRFDLNRSISIGFGVVGVWLIYSLLRCPAMDPSAKRGY